MKLKPTPTPTLTLEGEALTNDGQKSPYNVWNWKEPISTVTSDGWGGVL